MFCRQFREFPWRGGEYTGTDCKAEWYPKSMSFVATCGAEGNVLGGGGNSCLSKNWFCSFSIFTSFWDFAIAVSGDLFPSYPYIVQLLVLWIGYTRFGESMNAARICILANQGHVRLQHPPQQQQQQHHKHPVITNIIRLMQTMIAVTNILNGVLHRWISLHDLLASFVHP